MDNIPNDVDKKILKTISNIDISKLKGAYNIRKDGKLFVRNTTPNINIITKKDKDGIDIIIKENTKNESVHIPVILEKEGLNDVVYNDFHVGENADVTIIAGCGIHNDSHKKSEHDGIHTFYVGKNAKVKYVENHYGEGSGDGKNVLNPTTVIYLDNGATLEMETLQIQGVTSTVRTTKAYLKENSNLVIKEKIMTTDNQDATTDFYVELNGENSSTHVVSRSIAKDSSKQQFSSNIQGNTKCFAHVECDAILMDNAKVVAIPRIDANNIDANLIHEAAIGKIAGEQLIKLMSLGLSQKQAEQEIIKGFLK